MRVVVTRPAAQAGELVARLGALGHEVIVCPLIAIEPVGPDRIDLDGYEWLLVTSPNGAHELARRARGRPGRIAAIGPGTAAELEANGLDPDLVPAVSTQEGLLAELPRPAGRVLFAGAAGARSLLVDELEAEVVVLYRTRELKPDAFPDAELVVLASASAARAYGTLGRDAPAVSIGPETTRAAKASSVRVAAEAPTHDVAGLVAAVASLG